MRPEEFFFRFVLPALDFRMLPLDVNFIISDVTIITKKLDGVTSFFCDINVRNTCKRLCYSQIFGGISSVAERWKNLNDIIAFSSFLVVRIETDQVLCVNC